MPDEILLKVNGVEVSVPLGASVAVAITLAGQACRRSVGGEPRGPLCGMGICFECRANVNGKPHSRSCQVPCTPGMDVKSDE